MNLFSVVFIIFELLSAVSGSKRRDESTGGYFNSFADSAGWVANSADCGSDCESTLSFAGSEAAAYAVGSDIPGFPFRFKNSWAGNIPVGSSNPDATLWFWLWGAEQKEDTDALIIWLNGGPGCSSLLGFMQEVGPVTFLHKGDTPMANPWSWTNAANVVWLDHPVGTGFSTDTPTIQNEKDVAEQFSGFLANFFKAFPELASTKLYLAGESTAGSFIGNIADHIYAQGIPFNLRGFYINDGAIADEVLQLDAPAFDFAVKNQQILNITDSDLAEIKKAADDCALDDFVENNLLFPPKGPVDVVACNGTRPSELLLKLAFARNSCFSSYYIKQTCPSPINILGNPTDPPQTPTFFDEPELQSYIHAHQKWNLCKAGVFPNGDSSPPPTKNGALERAIEKSQRAIIVNGDLDARILTNGTLLSLQSMFWNGAQGFTKAPTSPLVGTTGEHSGRYVTERGLTFIEHFEAGLEVPLFDRPGALKSILFLLGRVPSLS